MNYETFKTHHFNPFLIIFIIRFRFFYHKHFCIRNLPAPCLLRPLLRYRAWYLCRSVSGRRAHSPAPRRHLCTAPVRSGGFPRQNTDMRHRTGSTAVIIPYVPSLLRQEMRNVRLPLNSIRRYGSSTPL